MKVVKLSIAMTAAVLSANAMANTVVESGRTVFKTVTAPAAVSAEIGTLGYGANIAWSANETAEVVAGWAGGSFNADTDIGGSDSIINWKKVLGSEYADTKAKLKFSGDLSNPYIGVNVRPFSNRLTVGTGVIFQDNKFDVALSPINNDPIHIKVNGTDYQVNSGEVKIKAESSRDLAPYVTIGFKPNANSNKRFGMFGELGAVYTGEWDTNVKVNGTVANNKAAELEKELTDKINKDNPEWYPIIKLGATYRF